MLKTLAPTTSAVAVHITHAGKRSLISDISPRPVESPRRAAVSWTAEASGSERGAVQTRSKRNAAPICE